MHQTDRNWLDLVKSQSLETKLLSIEGNMSSVYNALFIISEQVRELKRELGFLEDDD